MQDIIHEIRQPLIPFNKNHNLTLDSLVRQNHQTSKTISQEHLVSLFNQDDYDLENFMCEEC